MAYKYSTQTTDTCAKAVGIALPISRKASVNICRYIKGMNVQDAKELLEDVIELRQAIPYTRYNKDTPHRRGMAAGRYPVKACTHILALLKSAEANAQFKGLSTANLIIKHASAQPGARPVPSGRLRTQAKRAHIEFVLEEVKKPRAERKSEKPKPAEKPQTEAKQKTEAQQ